jgi:putative ABC transport system permease protein
MPEDLSQSRIWKVLSRLLPRRYRERYGRELLHLHSEGAKHARGPLFWAAVAWDVLVTALQLRVDALRGTPARAQVERVGVFDTMRHCFMLARRALLHAPGFTIAVVLTLALGIGANSTMFAILDRLLFSPPQHIANADRLRRVFVYGKTPFKPEIGYSSSMTYPDLRDLARTKAFAQLAGFSARTMTLGRGETSEQITVELASASYFPALGVRPKLGRFYVESEDDVHAAVPTVVLSHGFWQRRFGGAASVLGQTLDLGAGKYTVIGVAPPGFTGINLAPIDAWVPLRTAGAIESGTNWVDAYGWYWMQLVARLNPGVTDERTAAEASALYRSGQPLKEREDSSAQVRLASVIAARGPNRTQETIVAEALGGVALLVLLIACANVANLFLARSMQRRKQFAVQSALGVGRGRLLLQNLTEALLLAVSAAVLAYFISSAVAPALFRVLLKNAYLPTAGGLRAALMTGALALVTVLMGAFIPALRASRVDLLDALRSGRSSLRSSWARAALLGTQAALSVIMLVGAGLFVRSLQKATTVDLGLSLDALAVNLELDSETGDQHETEVTYQVFERLQRHPLVQHAAVSSIPPFNGFWGKRVYVPDADSTARGTMGPAFYSATADYFKTLNIPLLRGRALLAADDRRGAAPVAVVSKATANALWRDKDPLGKCMMIGDPRAKPPCTTVVGVVGDVQRDLTSGKPLLTYYVTPHHSDDEGSAGVVVVSVKGNPRDAIPAIREAARLAAPGIRFVTVQPISDFLEYDLRSWKLGATLLTIFGILALIVAAAGVYSVLAFDVVQRRFELGVRAALGAPAPRQVRSIVAQQLAVTAIGVIIGLAAALGLARLASDLLFRVRPTDPAVYVGVVLTLGAVAAAAAALPAWRATRVDPKIALLSE